MFKKEAEKYRSDLIQELIDKIRQGYDCKELSDIVVAFQKGADVGYAKGYRDAEKYYTNVIDSQHKLVDESEKEEFKKCMKCTDCTYQYGFKDGYNKASKWHFVKDGDLPEENKKYWVLTSDGEPKVDSWLSVSWVNSYDIVAWKEIVFPAMEEG